MLPRPCQLPMGACHENRMSHAAIPAAKERVIAVAEPAPLPAAFDWRGRNVISPPRNQGVCESCSSFAVAAAIGARLSITSPAGQLVEVSAGFLHTCLGHAGLTDPAAICSGPIDLNAMVNLVINNGYALATANDYPFA